MLPSQKILFLRWRTEKSFHKMKYILKIQTYPNDFSIRFVSQCCYHFLLQSPHKCSFLFLKSSSAWLSNFTRTSLIWCTAANAVSFFESRHFLSHRPHRCSLLPLKWTNVWCGAKKACKRNFYISKSWISSASPEILTFWKFKNVKYIIHFLNE